MHAALMTGDAPTINESGVCTAVNYIKVNAFLARGTCLFSPPRRLCFIFVSLVSSLYPPRVLFFSRSHLPLASFTFHF